MNAPLLAVKHAQQWLLCLILCAVTQTVIANEVKVYIIPFEAVDLTRYAPANAASTPQSNAAKVASELGEILSEQGEFEAVIMSDQEFNEKNVGTNFLYDKPKLVAELAQQQGVEDWAVVGRLYRPTPLFAYIQSKVVRVSTGTVRELLSVEFKGSDPKLIQKGIDRLAQQIKSTISE